MTSGDDIKEDNIKVTENNGNNKNSNSEFREKIKVDQTEEAKDEKIIDEILEKYNSKLDEENKIDNDVTVIKTTYKTENDNGTIAIIGPKRMDYERVVSMLEYIKKNIER